MIKLLSFPIVIASLFLVVACNSNTSTGQAEDATEVTAVPELEKAPEFEVVATNGETYSLEKSMSEGKPTVIYFTASWCPICAKNWPVLSEIYPEYKDRITLVAIGIDPTDDEEVMRKISEEKGFTFPITAGIPQVMLDFGVESQATTVGINKEGFIEFQENKTALTADEFRAMFDALLN